jgi:hypothetical protein
MRQAEFSWREVGCLSSRGSFQQPMSTESAWRPALSGGDLMALRCGSWAARSDRAVIKGGPAPTRAGRHIAATTTATTTGMSLRRGGSVLQTADPLDVRRLDGIIDPAANSAAKGWRRPWLRWCRKRDPQVEGHMASFIERRRFYTGGSAVVWPSPTGLKAHRRLVGRTPMANEAALTKSHSCLRRTKAPPSSRRKAS